VRVPASLYWPDTTDSVIQRMSYGAMPAPFTRRMRLVNLLSAVVLQKIDTKLLAPFSVEDLHHILDKQISQDAVIDQLDSMELAEALYNGNLQPLWNLGSGHTLTMVGIYSGWLQRFFYTPFDPLCIMLAMRTKLLLDAIDEMGHSYNLLRSIGYGWIDWGDIPGEIPGNPGDYYPPAIDNPIVIVPPPASSVPGSPGYFSHPGAPTAPSSGSPMPGAPGYVAPSPGSPGYAPVVAPIPRIVSPGGVAGARQSFGGGGGGGVGGPTGSMATPSGQLDQGLWTGPPGYAGSLQPTINCAWDKDDPTQHVHIGWDEAAMNCGATKTLTVEGYKPVCEADWYEWRLISTQGSLEPVVGYFSVYTAPEGGPDCETPVTVELWCEFVLCDTIDIAIRSCPASAHISFDNAQMQINQTKTLTAIADIPGCGTPEWEWAIASGDGSLSSDTGDSVVYTAPASNSNCVNNPTITLSCGGVLKDFCELAVNAVASHSYYAWREIVFDHCDCVNPNPPTYWVARGNYTFYFCDGTTQTGVSSSSITAGSCAAAWASLQADWSPSDMRSDPQKAAGCCPAKAL
jgi:hypothetical protein